MGLSWWMAADLVSAAAVASGAAQAWQNFARARLDAPHDGHGSGNGAAHSSQNFAPSWLSEPQLEQRIEIPRKSSQLPFFITQPRKAT
jgi:hypothetical protein